MTLKALSWKLWEGLKIMQCERDTEIEKKEEEIKNEFDQEEEKRSEKAKRTVGSAMVDEANV